MAADPHGQRAPLAVEEVARLLLCAPDTVRDLARSGDLPGVKVGRDWVFPAGAFYTRLDELALAAAQERRTPGKPAAHLHTLPARKAARPAARARPQPPMLPSLGA